MKNSSVKKHTYNIRFLLIIVILVGVFLLLFIKGVFAKYIYDKEQDTLYVANSFYFESDYLVEPTSNEVSSYVFQDDVDYIIINLMNYSDELRYSDISIDYTVTLVGENIESQVKSGTLDGGTKSSSDITFTNLNPGVYTVTATTEPYSKTLQGTFNIIDAVDDIAYSVNDSSGSPFLEVVVTSNKYSGLLDFTLPEGVRPDNTDVLLEEATVDECVVWVNSYSSYTFLFFKDNPTNVYSESDILVIEVD